MSNRPKQKAILIDAKNREVREVDYVTTNDINSFVGTPFCIGAYFPNEDVMFVDDEGLLNDTQDFFEVTGGHQPYAGNGLIVGKEILDEEGDLIKTADPTATVEWVRENVKFMTKTELANSIYAKYSEPSIGVFSIGD